jgi:hypothetical protein
MKFLVSIPAWGDRCPDFVAHTTLRTLLAGLRQCPVEGEIRFLVHTDRRDYLKTIFRGLDVEFRRVPFHECPYLTLGDAHREALAAAEPGEVVVLLCADQVLSRETLSSCVRRIAEGKKAILCLGPRTEFADFRNAPAGLSGPQVAQWSMDHAHPWTRACILGEGNSWSLSTVYVRGHNGVSCHAFHLHPIAVVKDRELSFARETIDNDLIDCFDKDEIHIVQRPEEFAVAEISPPDKSPTWATRKFDTSMIAEWAKRNASPMHRWLFCHRIRITDSDDGNPIAPSYEAMLEQLARLESGREEKAA